MMQLQVSHLSAGSLFVLLPLAVLLEVHPVLPLEEVHPVLPEAYVVLPLAVLQVVQPSSEAYQVPLLEVPY